ncbi:hypothetical protein IJ556_05185 [bacterium]|nr:hypothetical protein [bacterium]
MNLKKETIKELKENGKTLDDVLFICGNDFRVSLENFLMYSDTEYDNGYGGQEVASDLKIIGKDFIMIRHEYDGSEYWGYYSTIPPEKTECVCCFTQRQVEKLRSMITDENGFPIDKYVMSGGSLKEYNDEAKGGNRFG